MLHLISLRNSLAQESGQWFLPLNDNEDSFAGKANSLSSDYTRDIPIDWLLEKNFKEMLSCQSWKLWKFELKSLHRIFLTCNFCAQYLIIYEKFKGTQWPLFLVPNFQVNLEHTHICGDLSTILNDNSSLIERRNTQCDRPCDKLSGNLSSPLIIKPITSSCCGSSLSSISVDAHRWS